MKKITLAMSLLSMLALCSCNGLMLSGKMTTQEFKTEGVYTELEVSSAFNVNVSDAVSRITVTTDEKVMPNVVVELADGRLKIGLKSMKSSYGADLTVFVPYNSGLKTVILSGASEFHSNFPMEGESASIFLSGAAVFRGDLEAQSVTMDLSGASDFMGDVTATTLDLSLSGASDAEIEGHAGTVSAELTGASKIVRKTIGHQYSFSCNSFKGKVSGASSAYIHCDGEIVASVSGASDLHYTGNASTTGSSATGGSNIVHDVI